MNGLRNVLLVLKQLTKACEETVLNSTVTFFLIFSTSSNHNFICRFESLLKNSKSKTSIFGYLEE